MGSSPRQRYGATVWQRLGPVFPMLVVGVALLVASLTGSPPPDALAAWLTVCFGLLVLDILLPAYFGVTLTESAAVVRNLRRRTIPWADIQSIQIESIMGTRTVVLYEANGRRTRLRSPSTGFLAWDRRFEEKFHVIGQWWLTHRGPDWTPLPPRPAWTTTPQTPDEKNPFAPPA
ncbi:hypothetical protein [Streptomyces hokutonensis]|uniref:hypothetical protein n=1 Tax=Streptomyces hokutonensis TaxID=1306990 RepID=UPI0003A0D8FE|nr:hypothetical protein [Streptomyces hokutonensis]